MLSCTPRGSAEIKRPTLEKQIWVLRPLWLEWLGKEGEGEPSACRESALTLVALAERGPRPGLLHSRQSGTGTWDRGVVSHRLGCHLAFHFSPSFSLLNHEHAKSEKGKERGEMADHTKFRE